MLRTPVVDCHLKSSSMIGQVYAYEPLSKLLVSPLITPIVVPYIIPYITPFKEFRQWLIWFTPNPILPCRPYNRRLANQNLLVQSPKNPPIRFLPKYPTYLFGRIECERAFLGS